MTAGRVRRSAEELPIFDWLVDVWNWCWDNLYNVEALVSRCCQAGIAYWVLTAIVFVETGLMIGFFLPGDSLLVVAGVFAANGDLNIWYLNLLLIPAAIIGDTLGYAIGYHAGPALFTREKSLLFNPNHLVRARDFYERHGGKTIVIARFIPIIRTFAPVVAGIGRMEYRRFLMYNVFGGIGWVVSMTVLGYALVSAFPGTRQHLGKVVIGVILVSQLPVIWEFLRAKYGGHKSAVSTELNPPGYPVAPAAGLTPSAGANSPGDKPSAG